MLACFLSKLNETWSKMSTWGKTRQIDSFKVSVNYINITSSKYFLKMCYTIFDKKLTIIDRYKIISGIVNFPSICWIILSILVHYFKEEIPNLWTLNEYCSNIFKNFFSLVLCDIINNRLSIQLYWINWWLFVYKRCNGTIQMGV